MISCKKVLEPASDPQPNIMKLVLVRTNQEVGSMGVGAGLYIDVVVVKRSRSLSHLLTSSCEYLASSQTSQQIDSDTEFDQLRATADTSL